MYRKFKISILKNNNIFCLQGHQWAWGQVLICLLLKTKNHMVGIHSGNCVEIFLTTTHFQCNFEKYSILKKKKNQIQTMKRFCHLDNRNTLVNLHIYTSPVIYTTFCILFQVSVWPLMKEIWIQFWYVKCKSTYIHIIWHADALKFIPWKRRYYWISKNER